MDLRKKAIVAGVVMWASEVVHAGEGMWVPQQLPEIDGALKEAGLELDPAQLANLTGDPMGAVVWLGGCTGSFVSPEGLVMTNHHCANRSITFNSTPDKNLVHDGFIAGERHKELRASPNTRVYPLESIRDVTADAQAAIHSATDASGRKAALEKRQKELIAQCEADGGYRCDVYSFMGGNTYRLFRFIEIQDVRLVYAPPEGIGYFGGDADNWMWPRHTGDFTFYRAYVGKNGKPAPFSKDNVPYRPNHWLKFSEQPLSEGDFVMVAGYPAQTSRHALAGELEVSVGETYPLLLRHSRALVELWQQAGGENPDIALKYNGHVDGYQNYIKYLEGQLEGFRRTGAVSQKNIEERELLEWLRQRGPEGKPALRAHEKLVSLMEPVRSTRERDAYLEWFQRDGVMQAALLLYRSAIEREKPDAEREPGYQERDLARREGTLRQLDAYYHPEMDLRVQDYWLRQYVSLPPAQRIAELDAWLGGDDERAVRRAVDRLADSRLGNLDERLKWFSEDRAAFEASNDPAIQYAVAVMPTLLARERQTKARDGEALITRPVYLQALADFGKSQGRPVYPDANGSLRIAFGHVTGYTTPEGTRQEAFTTLEQVAAKATGVSPFDAPPAQLEAIAAKRYGGLDDATLGSVPVNFLSDLHITGGNSGSPMLNARGELVGLVFDGTWESVSSDWVFDPTTTRTIAVDTRYLRWVLQEAYPAPALLSELGVGGGNAAAASAR